MQTYILACSSIYHILLSFYFSFKFKQNCKKNNFKNNILVNHLILVIINSIVSITKMIMIFYYDKLIYINPYTDYRIYIMNYIEWLFTLPLCIVLLMNNMFIYYNIYEYCFNIFFMLLMFLFGILAGLANTLFLYYVCFIISFLGMIIIIYFEMMSYFNIVKDNKKKIVFYTIMLFCVLYGLAYIFYGKYDYIYYIFLFLDIITKTFIAIMLN